jgi:hypothetical protein
MELRGLKVNMEKTKAMITGKKSRNKVKSGRYQCGCCGKGVGVNSLLCVNCKEWCHLRCSGLKSVRGVHDFQCPECRRGNEREVEGRGLVTKNGEIEEITKFCYLGVMMDCEASVERAVRARVAAAWKKWREMASLLNNRYIPLKIRGSVYESCVRSVMLYGAETWEMTGRVEDIMKHCDRRMLRYIAEVSWKDKVNSEEVAKRCGLKEIREKMRHRRLQWFGYVRREKGGGGVRRVEEINVPGARPVGRPKRTWRQTVQMDMDLLEITEDLAMDRAGWRRVIASPTPITGKKDYKRK